MVKIHVNLYLDLEVMQLAKEKFGNVSGLVNSLLKDALIDKKPEIKEYFDVLKAKEKIKKEIKELKKEKKEKKKVINQTKEDYSEVDY